ncbi:hypothetical protein WOLCODRAFT_167418 [Wolfiporia cocos MD-104 SS10]|uniref:Uncharacterized protein n=1 Tax=Wolfiporia cocos (strain MD-104) TaxID=742152 RepID=A0A2H3JEZ9_WOLCO|nr:hypothetical protein WOLCODRAFT_167418 [Wolfiporia cocos MD-104 SS10]
MPLMDDEHADYVFYYPHPERATAEAVIWTEKLSKKSLKAFFLEACKDNLVLDELYNSKEPFTLYKPIGLSFDPFETLLARSRQWLREHHHIEQDKLPAAERIARAFPDGPDLDDVNILIVTAEILESLEDVGDLEARHRKVIRQREMEVRRIRESFPAPSAGVKSFSGVQMVVNDNADSFHAGRPASNHGPPVALFDPTLGLLAYYLSHLDDDIPEIEPNHLQIGAVHMFMEQALCSYENEGKRLTAIEKSLQQAIGIDMSWKQSICGIIPDAVFGAKLPYVV